MKKRVERLEKRIKPLAARKPLRVVVQKPGDPAPKPEDVEGSDVLVIRVIPVGDAEGGAKAR